MKQRIAVLGGGMGSLVTVFELTRLAGWRDRYDITVYQEGWRLGGKGASGRNAATNQRIEEHGLHILFGFYDNAFRVMRDCYRELARHPDAPLSTIEKAFEPADRITMMEFDGSTWSPWNLYAPRNNKIPGVHTDGLDLSRLLTDIFAWIAKELDQLFKHAPDHPVAIARRTIKNKTALEVRTEVRRIVHGAGGRTSILTSVFATFDTLTSGVEEAGEHVFIDLAHKLAELQKAEDLGLIRDLVRRFHKFMWELEPVTQDLPRVRKMIDFALAVATGLVADGLLETHDWFSIDDVDLRQWLKKHGAKDETVDSPMVAGLYDAAFSTFAPSAAGTSLHGFLRMALTYKGAIMYKMQSGMGDTIFAPLYEVLRRRGVKFEFFQQVQSLGVSGDRIDKIRMRRQATPITEYKPLVDVKGLPCWPSAPLFAQLEEGDKLQQSKQDLEDWWTSWPGASDWELELGRDFDAVVLGISVGAFPYIAKELMDASPPFRDMVTHVKTTQTQCFQLWMRPNLANMGWKGVPPVTIPYGEPFDTWADMTHLVKSEDWPAATVGHLAYMCSAMEDDGPLPERSEHGYAQKQNERCKANAIEWLEKQAGLLWPGIATTNDARAVDFGHLVDAKERDGAARFDAQYWRAPYSPSERYVLAVPNSNKYRLRSDESGFSNLFMCGDWTKTALSVGCLESATMGGIQAAHAIDPNVATAINDWLPPRGQERRLVARPEPVVIQPLQSRRANRELPAYIETDANQIASPPIRIDVGVSMFLLDADLAHLRAICDEQLNLPGSPVRYEPLGPFCVLYCSTVDNYPLRDPIGWVPEKDFGIWMPVVAGRGRGPLFVAERVVTYTPYIWVDNGVALIGGRTVFGFAKQLGSMRLPNKPGEVGEYSLDTLVVPHYAPDAKAEERRVLTVRPHEQGVIGELRDAWNTGENLLEAFGEELDGVVRRGGVHLPVPGWSFVKQMLESVTHAGMRMVFLKQFPDAFDGTKACYQAIVESNLPIQGLVQGGRLPGNWEVEIRRYDSHRIVEKLGLRPTSGTADVAVVPSLVHGWSKFTAEVQPGTIVYQAT